MMKAKSVMISVAIIAIAVSAVIIKAVSDGASATDETSKSNQKVFSAAENGDIGQVKQPVEKGTSVSGQTNELNQELFNAAKNGDIDQVRQLVEKGADVNFRIRGATVLIEVTMEGHLDIVKFLIEKGADVNAGGLAGITPLSVASLMGRLDIVQFFVDNGADINAGVMGTTALMLASDKGHLDIVKFFVDKGADINAVDKTSSATALMFASQEGRLDVVKFLVEKGADVNAVTTGRASGHTALTLASQGGYLDIVEFLVEKGADVNAFNKLTNTTALMFASQEGHLDVVKFLVEKGADVNVVTTGRLSGHTALTYASQGGYIDVVEFLVDKGADVNARTTGDVEGGTTALMIASQKRYFDIVKFLAEKGADVNAVNQEGKTARDYAIKSVKIKVSDYIETLLKYNPFTCKSYKSTFTYFTQAENNTNKNTQVPTVKGLLKKEKSGINDIGNYQQTTEAPDKHLEITIDLALVENKLVFNYGIEPQSEERNGQIPLYQQIFTEDMANTHAYIIFPKEWELSAEYQVIETIKISDGSHYSFMASSPENSEFSLLLIYYNASLEGSLWSIDSDKSQFERAVDTTKDGDEKRRIEKLQEKYEDYQIYKIPFYIPEGITQAYSNIGRSHTIYFDKSSLTGNGKIFIEIPQITFKQTASGARKESNLEGLAYEIDIPEIGFSYDPEYRFIETSTGLKKKKIDLGGDITMEFVYVPGGEFMMGSPSNEKRRFFNESPQHQVKISKGFWMGVYELTNSQYLQFIKESSYDNYDGIRESNANYLRHILKTDYNTPEQVSGYPVIWVSWNNARAFCEWLSVKEGKTYRLPTEAEWEYACRAGRTTELDIKDDGLFLKSSGGRASSMRGIHSVGQNKPNSYGLYDMYDNVREWCRDWYGSYSDTTEVDPEGPNSGDERVVRGDYSGNIISYRCAERFCYPPDNPNNKIGFRVVCEN